MVYRPDHLRVLKQLPFFSVFLKRYQQRARPSEVPIVTHVKKSATSLEIENVPRVVSAASKSSGKTIYSFSTTNTKNAVCAMSIIIPTRDQYRLLKRCVTSILKKTTYTDYHLIIIDNNTTDPTACLYLQFLSRHPRIQVIPYIAPFHFAAMNNMAVQYTNASSIVFLNNDTKVITPNWLELLLQEAQKDSVGAVGCKLLYPNNTIQHAGIHYDGSGFPQHLYRHCQRYATEDADNAQGGESRAVVAVTGACMVVNRTAFEAVGGFDEQFPSNFNDIDLCLKLRQRGYSIIYTPHVELYHNEYASRGEFQEQSQQFSQEWYRFSDKWRQ